MDEDMGMGREKRDGEERGKGDGRERILDMGKNWIR